MSTSAPEVDPFPDVHEWQRELVARYGQLLTNTGGNDPLDLLQDLQRPGTDDQPNRLMTTNVVRFLLAASINAQLSLLARLERDGLVTAP